ncbi:trimeric autotransporter adhesin [Paraburkholderia unamae]|uniref:beta strand repeat-containing protein n=1 Tax=Paraburkholderia unamae TaxID=219649 RepID=UPI000DC27FFC|nr:ESPR-type extended signal peptide-containing protein [Paraburkholderia unamae]RAR61838.1 trimeric autotransporter adhesin [Paraburkholderia unamae]
MNKTYRSVWNESTGTWVAADENTRARGKKAQASTVVLAAGVVLAGYSAVGFAGTLDGGYLDPNNGMLNGYAVAYGQGSVANTSFTTLESTAIGGNATAGANGSIAVGYSSSVIAGGVPGSMSVAQPAGVAVGTKAVSNGAQALALGYGANALHDYSVVLGAQSVTNANGAEVFGTAATAGGTNSLAIGYAGVASATNSVALGAGATADRANAVSVGTATTQNQIINVANGILSATSTDVVNGSQLYALANSEANAFGAGSTVNSNGSISSPQYVQNGATFTDVGSALNNIANGGGIEYFHTNSTLGDSSAKGTNSTAIGPVATAAGTNAIAIGNGAYVASTVNNSVALGNGATVSAAATPTASVTISGKSYTVAGASPTGVVSVGAANAERQITNVAAGNVNASSTDAVNGSQLFATDSQVTQNSTNISNLQGSVTTIQAQLPNVVLYDSSAHNKVTLGGTGASAAVKLTNVAAADVSASSTDAVNGSQLYATNTNISNISGDVTNIGGQLTSINSQITTINGQLADVVLYDSSAHNKVTLGGTGASAAVKLANVAAGDVSTSSTDAINGSQLYATNADVSNLAGDVTNLNGQVTTISGQLANAVMYDSSAHSSVTLGGTGASAAVKLTNVAAGDVSTSSTDAINGSQLNATNASVSNLAGDVTNLAGDVTNLNGQVTTINGQLANAVMYDSSAHSSVTLGGTGASAAVKLTNVAAGDLSASSTDAVNGAQLYATNQSVSNLSGDITSISGQLADAVMYDSSAHASVTLGGTGASTAVKLTNVAAGGVSASSTDAVNGSQLYATNANVSNVAGSVTSINSQLTTINGQLADAVLYDSSAHASVTLGGTAASAALKLTNVAAGDLSASSTDAVNGSQLYATNTNISNIAGDVTNLGGQVTSMNSQITTINGQLADAVMYDSSAHSTVTLGGSGASAAVKLTNVAAGDLNASSTDAVNGAQLYATNESVSNLAGRSRPSTVSLLMR